jgi:PleD family two-component response regulator
MSNYDPLDLKGQEKERDSKKVTSKIDRENEEADIKWLMSSKRGRRVIWRLLEQAGVFRLSFNTNAMAMSFSEGNRNFGLQILTLVHTLCPELYPTMIKEQKNVRDADDGSQPTK